MQINKNEFLEELYQAYIDCRKNKRNTYYALEFENDFEYNLSQLAGEMLAGSYAPQTSQAFILHKPVMREIFAANFRDRVVHHWLISRLNPAFEREFIYDSYACRKNRGSLMGVRRLDRAIRKCSKNYKQDCYILKLDIQGFFININRKILWDKLCLFIENNYFADNKNFVLQIAAIITLNNPLKNCKIKGRRNDWQNLPKSKSLFYARNNCGIPIGNLTSQIFANFYMNEFDHYVKHSLSMKYYGRYVDDFYLVSQNKKQLICAKYLMANYLQQQLQLKLHPRKVILQHYSKGITFLGAIIKPMRTYAGSRVKGNFYNAINQHNKVAMEKKPTFAELNSFLSCVNSYLGLLKHMNSYHLRKKMLRKYISIWWWNLAYISGGYSKLLCKVKTVNKSIQPYG